MEHAQGPPEGKLQPAREAGQGPTTPLAGASASGWWTPQPMHHPGIPRAAHYHKPSLSRPPAASSQIYHYLTFLFWSDRRVRRVLFGVNFRVQRAAGYSDIRISYVH